MLQSPHCEFDDLFEACGLTRSWNSFPSALAVADFAPIVYSLIPDRAESVLGSGLYTPTTADDSTRLSLMAIATDYQW